MIHTVDADGLVQGIGSYSAEYKPMAFQLFMEVSKPQSPQLKTKPLVRACPC